MAYAKNTFTYSGGPQVFATNFALGALEVDHVRLAVDGELDSLGNQVYRDITYDPVTGDVTVNTPLPNPSAGYIERVTPVSEVIVDFEQGRDITRRNLSRSTKQTLMVVQEVSDRFDALDDRITENTATLDNIVDDTQAAVGLAQSAANIAVLAASASEAARDTAIAKENSMLRDRGAWLTATAYTQSDIVTQQGSSYICIVPHTSEVFSADLSAARWRIFAAKGDTGSGTGDMLRANNLNDVLDAAEARNNLGASTVGNALFTASWAGEARSTLGLGSAAVLAAGTGANNVVTLDSEARLPAVDGSQLTNLPDAATTSAEQTLVANTVLTIPHGLSSAPMEFYLRLRCITAEHGYAVGDFVFPRGGPAWFGDSATDGFSVYADSANIYVAVPFYIVINAKATTGGLAYATHAHWRLTVRVRP